MAFRPPRRRSLDQVPLNLASMIDVTFLLLIYFMVSTVLAPDERTLETAIKREQEGASRDERDFRPQRVRVLRDAEGPLWRLGQRAIRERGELERIMADLPTEAGMVVEVEGGVPVEVAVAALQAARDAGFTEVSYVPAR
ncbi:MAG: ExbD/TolR family protein [Planctomycetota bacterium]|jgi:biopolymer transport protein ExbD